MRNAMNWKKGLAVLMMLLSFCGGWAAADTTGLGLTAEEQLFLEEHPILSIGIDPEFIPYEFLDTDGVYKGIAADYLNLIAEETGLEYEIARGLTWAQAYDYAAEGKLDVLSCISKTAQREKLFLFSDPYISFQRVIFVSKDNAVINSFEDLYGTTVAVQKNSSHQGYLTDYGDIRVSQYDTAEDALMAIANGTEQAFIGNLATSIYLAKQYSITNLKYIPISTEEPQSLYFAVRKDWPELVSILNKALAAIDEETKLAISDHWISVEASTDTSWLKWAILGTVSVVVLIALVSAFWIRRLKMEIQIRKAAQAALEKAKQEADEANQYKSSFLARMSHEIRTPLSGVIGMAYLLKKTSLSTTQKMYVERVTQSSNNMLGIINDILDFSKIEAGKVELEAVPFSLDRVIEDVFGIVSFKIEENRIGLKLVKDPLVPNWFVGDAKRVEQILINLLNNAAKFTSDGEVSLEIRLVARENDKYHLSFTVKDTGIGMTEEQIGRLFSPFMQGDISINRRFGGTGLGLSIVKYLVDLMGGWIQVFSVPGEGSTFIINLSMPMDKPHEDAYKRCVTSQSFKDVRTLVLEKTNAGMNLLHSYLEAFGMQSELTTSPLSALSMLQAANGRYAKPFDLLIVDYDTPSDGGFTFVDTVFSNPRIAQKPKILMLLPMMREDLFDVLNQHGVETGILKPIVPSVLLNAILDIFKLKASSAAQTADAAPCDPLAFDKPYTILLAEDNKTNQLIAQTLLEQAGGTVLLAENGKIAADLFSQNRDMTDLVLMDLHMPVMNGYEAADEIRKLSAEVPIVAMTADVIFGVREACRKHGIYHYITKPFDPDQFMQTVRGILRIGAKQDKADTQRINTVAGLKNMGMNQALYLRVLQQYRTENAETAIGLQRAVNEQRYADAAEIVHKLKSSAGSIGAKALYELAVRLQKALKEENRQDIAMITPKFTAMLSAVMDEIDQIQVPPDFQ